MTTLLPIGSLFIETVPLSRSSSSEIPLIATHRRTIWRVSGYENVKLPDGTVGLAELLEYVGGEYVPQLGKLAGDEWRIS